MRLIPDHPGVVPSVVSGSPISICGAAILKSQCRASSSPPPYALPLSTATVVCGNAARDANARCPDRVHAPRTASGLVCRNSPVSAPAQNTRSPLARTSTMRTSGLHSSCSIRRRSSTMRCEFSAFRLAGLSRIRFATGPLISRRTPPGWSFTAWSAAGWSTGVRSTGRCWPGRRGRHRVPTLPFRRTGRVTRAWRTRR